MREFVLFHWKTEKAIIKENGEYTVHKDMKSALAVLMRWVHDCVRVADLYTFFFAFCDKKGEFVFFEIPILCKEKETEKDHLPELRRVLAAILTKEHYKQIMPVVERRLK